MQTSSNSESPTNIASEPNWVYNSYRDLLSWKTENGRFNREFEEIISLNGSSKPLKTKIYNRKGSHRIWVLKIFEDFECESVMEELVKEVFAMKFLKSPSVLSLEDFFLDNQVRFVSDCL